MVTSVSTNYCKIKWSWSGSNLKHSFLRVLEAKWSKIKVEPITSSNTGPFSGQQMRQSSICPKMYKRREGERDFWSFKQGYVFFLRASSSQVCWQPSILRWQQKFQHLHHLMPRGSIIIIFIIINNNNKNEGTYTIPFKKKSSKDLKIFTRQCFLKISCRNLQITFQITSIISIHLYTIVKPESPLQRLCIQMYIDTSGLSLHLVLESEENKFYHNIPFSFMFRMMAVSAST